MQFGIQLKPGSVFIRPLLYHHRAQDDRISQVVVLGMNDQCALCAFAIAIAIGQLGDNCAGDIIDQFRLPVPVISATVLDEVSLRGTFIVVEMVNGFGATSGEQHVGGAGVALAHACPGNGRAVLGATVDLELRVVGDIAVVEDFVRRGISAEAVEPFTAVAGVADDFESEVVASGGGGGSWSVVHFFEYVCVGLGLLVSECSLFARLMTGTMGGRRGDIYIRRNCAKAISVKGNVIYYCNAVPRMTEV